MTRLSARGAAAAGALLLALGAAAAPAEPARPVLVELFTSQGCSSCPPADRLLTELAAEGSAGVPVIALSYHVDYWNYIGWTDPFSAADWSARQRRYAARLAAGRVYTPQLVIDGVAECVGSDRREVRRLVASAARRPPGAELRMARGADSQWTLSAALPAAATATAEVQLVLFETGLSTAVGKGENARRTLDNDFVVRRLTVLGELSPGERWQGEHTPAPDPSWRTDRLGVVVLVRSTASLEVLAAASAPLTREP